MADRARTDIVLQTSAGAVRANKVLQFYEEDQTTPLAQSLYAAESGGSPLSPPYTTNSLGTFRAFTPNPQRAYGLASDDATKFPVDFLPDPADMILQGQSGRSLVDLTITTDLTTQRWFFLEGTVTAAQINSALAAGHLNLVIPKGTHLIDTKITVPYGATIRGMGQTSTVLRWTGAVGGIMLEYSAGSFTPSQIMIADLTISSTTVATVTGIRIINGGFETFANLWFQGIETPMYIDGGFRPSVRNVFTSGSGANSAGGSYFANLPHIELDGYTSYGTSTATAVLTFHAIAAGQVSHVNAYAPLTIGIIIQGDTQGLTLTGGTILSMTKGIVVQISGGSSPTFCDVIGFNLDQATVNSVHVSGGGQITFTRCQFTNMTGAIDAFLFGAQADVIRLGIYFCTFENIGRHGINATAGAGYFNIVGNTFLGMGTSGGTGVPFNLPAGASSDIRVSWNDMRNNTNGTIIDAANSGGTREYIGNKGSAPVITNTAGTIVQADTIEYNTTSGAKLGIGAVPTKTLEAYQATVGFPIVLRVTNYDNTALSGAVIGLEATGGAEARGAKAGIGLERTTTFGRGKLHFLIDNTADASEITLTDSAGHVAPDAGLAWGAAAVSGGAGTITSIGFNHAVSATATAAGGALGMKIGSSGIGWYWGSGAPTISAAKGSFYMRTDGSSTSTRMYINTDGGTTWTNVTTAA